MSPVRVSRAQVLAYRVAAQGLHRGSASVADLAVLGIGVQEAMGSPAALAFAARLDADVALGPADVAVGPGTDFAFVWSLRGAPHVHPRGEVDALAAALYPLSEQDAAARLNETGPSVRKAGIAALEQFGLAVTQLRAAVRTPTGKGAASSAVSAELPPAMLRDCRVCKARHISDSAMRVASLPAGLELEPGTSPPVLHRRPRARIPSKADPRALATLARRYLSLLGPATLGDVAGYLDARRADVETTLAGELTDLVEVDVDGRAALLPAERSDALAAAPDPEPVRLLGPFDPYLQARDRTLLVPDPAAQKALWPVLGRPGAVLADGEVAGTWRPKSAASRLTITVDAFAPLPPAVWTALEAEAERVAEVRGAKAVRLVRAG